MLEYGIAAFVGFFLVGCVVLSVLLKELLGVRYIANDKVGIVEKLWSGSGSIPEGNIIALNGEAGFQADILRGGLHFGLWRWQFKIHKVPLVTIPQNKIGYIYARDGSPLTAGQTLGRVIGCNNFQNSRQFLGQVALSPEEREGLGVGQRGRQRAILREGVYAMNLALFTVVAEDRVYSLIQNRNEQAMVHGWQKELADVFAFSPTVIGGQRDDIGIVTVQDGPALPTGEIIAPEVHSHNNYQDPEAFLAARGCRGKQYAVLTDGTYFINRWFATVEHVAKTVIPIGYVGVVNSYYGEAGSDTSGDMFRHGERVKHGQKGVWDTPLGPGKYAFNLYAGFITLVPTTNFVLHWQTGRSEAHNYDENLRSVDLVTKDAYEPSLPLSVVVHIDYKRAPGVIQRFGDVKKLITQSIDPMLSAYFRDVAHTKTMLELLHDRDVMQAEARKALHDKFSAFDIECVDVLVGKPNTADGASGENGKKIEQLLDQLRQRQLAKEQVETYQHRQVAAAKERELNETTARTTKQKELTDSEIQIKIAENQGNAELSRAEMKKRQTIVEAEARLEQSKREAQTIVINAKADAEQTLVKAEANSQSLILAGKGEGQKTMQIGMSQAITLQQKVNAYGDPRLYAMIQTAAELAKSVQPLVPERVFTQAGGAGEGLAAGGNVFSNFLSLLMAENTTFAKDADGKASNPAITEMTDKLIASALGTMNGTNGSGDGKPEPATLPVRN